MARKVPGCQLVQLIFVLEINGHCGIMVRKENLFMAAKPKTAKSTKAAGAMKKKPATKRTAK